MAEPERWKRRTVETGSVFSDRDVVSHSDVIESHLKSTFMLN